jgi:hypothetical protein
LPDAEAVADTSARTRQALASQSAELDDLRLQVPQRRRLFSNNIDVFLMPWSPSRLAQLLSSASSGQRTLARVTAATAAQAEQDMNNELSLLRKDAKKLELVNANLHEQLEAANANALKEKAAAEAHLAQVVQGLKLVIQELEGQLKQQVRFLNLVF